VKVASREEVKKSMGLTINTNEKQVNLFKKRKQPATVSQASEPVEMIFSNEHSSNLEDNYE